MIYISTHKVISLGKGQVYQQVHIFKSAGVIGGWVAFVVKFVKYGGSGLKKSIVLFQLCSRVIK
jgi:hypothetical protein